MARSVKSDVKADTVQSLQAQRIAYASTFAVKLAGDAELTSDMREYAKSKVVARRSATWVYNDLLLTLGAEFMAGLPEPDSENSDKTPTNNPDKYKYPGKNSKGNSTMLSGSFYDDLLEQLPYGKEVQAQIDDITLAQDVATRAKASAEAQAMSPVERLANKQTLYNNKSNAKALLKRAAKIAIQFEKAKLCPKVLVTFVKDSKGDLLSATNPIIIRDADLVNRPDAFDTITDTTFLALDFVEASQGKDGGTYEEVIATTSGKDTSDDDDAAEVPAIDGDIERYEEYTAEMAAETGKITMQKKISDILKAQKEEHDDFVLSLFTLAGELETLLAPHGKRQDLAMERVNAKVGKSA